MSTFARTLNASLRLSLFALLMLSSTTLVYLALKNPIAAQKQSALLAKFHELTPNVALSASFLQQAQRLTLGRFPVVHYRAPSGEHYLETYTPNGYAGNIRLLLALSPDQTTVLGVRVLEHKETPGLGDKIDLRVSDWILSFNHTSLATTRFNVKKDGGDFDAFTGATITPRAIVRHVGALLQTLPQSALSREVQP